MSHIPEKFKFQKHLNIEHTKKLPGGLATGVCLFGLKSLVLKKKTKILIGC